MRVFFGTPILPLTVEPLKAIPLPLLSQIPVLGPVFFTQNILTYLIYGIVPLSWFILYRTSLGLTIRSAGENPEAVDVAGISVERIRFSTVLLAGAMGGIAGAFYSIGSRDVYRQHHWGSGMDRVCYLLSRQLESTWRVGRNCRFWACGGYCHLHAVIGRHAVS